MFRIIEKVRRGWALAVAGAQLEEYKNLKKPLKN